MHLLRNSFKALKPVYTAPFEQAAKDRFAEFAQQWGQRYPAIMRLRESSWASVRAVLGVRRGDPLR